MAVKEKADATFTRTVTVEGATTLTGGATLGALGVASSFPGVNTFSGTNVLSGKTIISAPGGVIKYQGAQATTADSTAVITAANVLTQIIQCTPTGDLSKATDTAANFVSGLGITVDDTSFDFSIINLATDGSSHITITAGTGVTLVGCMVISAQDLAQDAFTSGVGRFRLRRTGATAMTLYRIG